MRKNFKIINKKMSFIHRKDEIARRNEDKKEERRERRDKKLGKRGKFKNEILTRVEMFNKWRFQYQMNYLEYDGIKVIELVTKRLESINMTNNDEENEEEENRVYEDVEKIIRDEMERVYKDLNCDIIINSIQVDIYELEENEELDTKRKEELMNNLKTFKDMIEKEIKEREEEIINIYGFYLNFVSECFSLKALEKVFKEIKKTFGKDIYIPKDSVYLKEKIDRAPEKEQKLFSILDNITGIKKISEIGWVY